MYKKNKVLAIIPARGGSKGIKNKNLVALSNKPLIAYTIKSARKSNHLDRVVVTTDNKDIAAAAVKFGADVPFLRPKRLARDSSRGIDAILHTINWLEDNDEFYDIAVVLQPTSPLRSALDIDLSLKLLFSKKAKAIVSVCRCEHPPFWTGKVLKNGSMRGFMNKKYLQINRQALEGFFRLNGALYVSFVKDLKKRNSFYGPYTYAYIMPPERSIDIDTPWDLKLANMILVSGNKG